ncbi:LysR substrate-binding domain-containing protein [Neisseriaceae bacterium TC5R-5]|nr:LysR substrate-binding domain-containing protein [Neisseriaceae bacterium TC5R-5]
MLFNTEALHAFIITAKYKSFAAAALRLHKVPNAISYTIHKLEDSLGVALFERDGKLLRLTEAGRFFLQKSQHILAEFEEVTDATRQIAKGYETELRISVNNIVSLHPLFPLLQESEQLFPQTEIHIGTDVHNGVWDALIDQRAAIAIAAPNERLSGADIMTREMGQVNWLFAISPQHPLAAVSGLLGDEMLKPYPAICISDTSVQLEQKEAWRLRGQKALSAPDYYHKIKLHIAGLGIGFLPDYLCQPYLEQGLLVSKAVANPKPTTPLFLAWQQPSTGHCQAWWLERLQQPALLSSWTQTAL